MSLKTSMYLYITKGKDIAIPANKSRLNFAKDLSKDKLISKKIRKHLPSSRQLLKFSALILLPMIILLLLSSLFNIKLFLFSLAVCPIIYFWIEIAEVFAEAKVLTKKFLIVYSLIGIVYLLLGLGLGTKSLYNLVKFDSAAAVVFCVFKGYNILMRGLACKDISLKTGSVISIATLSLTILLFNLNKIAFWAFVGFIMLAYEILFWVVRFIIEHRSNKTYISDMYGHYDG